MNVSVQEDHRKQLVADFKTVVADAEALLKATANQGGEELANVRDEAVHELLRSRGAALTQADTEEAPVTELVRTADWGYLRLRRPDYDEPALTEWAARLSDTGWREVYVFFKHEDEGAGPALARRFADTAGDTGGRCAQRREPDEDGYGPRYR